MVGTAMNFYGNFPGRVTDPPGEQSLLKGTIKADTDEADRPQETKQGVRSWVNAHMQIAGLLCSQEMSKQGCDREHDANWRQ